MSNTPKRFFATADKVIFILFFILIIPKQLLASPNAGVCIQNSSRTLQVKIGKGIIANLSIKSCGNIDGSGHVLTRVEIGHNVQFLKSEYESSSYSIDVNSSIDLNNDGTPDLGVSDGKGRDSNGMHYWIFDPSTKLYSDLGEAPAIEKSQDGENTPFAVVSSSGEIQSIRYDFEIIKNKLKVKCAIGFIPIGKDYDIALLKINEDGSYEEEKRIRGVRADQAQACMSGKSYCKFRQ